MIKRRIDVCGALVLLVLASPVLALAALAVLATMGLPILDRQRRIGRGGQPFELFAFRTMGPRLCANWPDALRITPVGHALLSTGADRLPELVNVLLGDLSLVGPRPLGPADGARCTPAQRRRFEARPGITGLEQVSGGFSWNEQRDLDVWYVDNATPQLDLRILGRALLGLVAGGGTVGAGAARRSAAR